MSRSVMKDMIRQYEKTLKELCVRNKKQRE